MRALTARAALSAWERGQSLEPSDRALAILTAALPEVSRDRLRRLPVGQRDALLLRLRLRTFGPLVRGFAHCPSCETPLEFDLDVRRYAPDDHLQRRLPPEWLTADGFEILFRLPDSSDFDAMVNNCMEVDQARRQLLRRCLLEVRRDGAEVPLGELSQAAVERLGERMEELDPLAELPLAITCERCEHQWTVLFDIGLFLWQDIAQAAQHLLDEVHALATAYGWREPEILALSAARRRYYIDKIPTRA